MVSVAVHHAAEAETVRFQLELVNEICVLEFAEIFPSLLLVEFCEFEAFGLKMFGGICCSQEVGHLVLVASSAAVDLLIAVALGVAALVHP